MDLEALADMVAAHDRQFERSDADEERAARVKAATVAGVEL